MIRDRFYALRWEQQQAIRRGRDILVAWTLAVLLIAGLLAVLFEATR